MKPRIYSILRTSPNDSRVKARIWILEYFGEKTATTSHAGAVYRLINSDHARLLAQRRRERTHRCGFTMRPDARRVTGWNCDKCGMVEAEEAMP